MSGESFKKQRQHTLITMSSYIDHNVIARILTCAWFEDRKYSDES